MVGVGLAGWLGCAGGDLALLVVDEAGDPVPTAWATSGSERFDADRRGEIHLGRPDHPRALVVGAPGALPEPLTLGASDLGELVEVRLLDDHDGRRTVLHFTGDVMIGRRYQSPTEGPPLVPADDPDAARRLVSDAAPFLSLADLTLVNLETVVGEAPDEAAYPGKRWLLQTPPSALASLEPLGVDLAVLANNHQRDWLDEGVAGTLDALDARGLPSVGAALDEQDAATGRILETHAGLRVGVLAWTSVDGDFVNDAYPTDEVHRPDDVPDEDAWQWEPRSWGVPELGIDDEPRRIGGAWAAIEGAEPSLDEEERARAWSSATAVYPELQDWVARRGHGGAARWNAETSPAAIADLRARADLVVVELHMGYQFASVPGDGTRAAARLAIDAGADLVVAHHPHVLQGIEWYRGHLIAYSLGNFVFDQDFLSTFRSAFLRTVWEDGALVEARIVPLFLDAYRPVPAADGLADQTLRALWEGSLLAATAARGSDLGVRAVADPTVAGDVTFRLDHHTALVTEAVPRTTERRLDVPCEGAVRLPSHALIARPIEGPAGLHVGREVDLLGSFDDVDADAVADDTVGWTWSSDDVSLVGDRRGQDRALELRRNETQVDRLSARMVARVSLPAHRLWGDAEGRVALDGPATYAIRIRVERVGSALPASVRLAMYHFDDLNPTEEPESVALREVELPIDAARRAGEQWLEVPAGALAPVDGLEPNAALLYVSVGPPDVGAGALRLWDLAVVEWRPANADAPGWAAVDWLRAAGACGPVTLRTAEL